MSRTRHVMEDTTCAVAGGIAVGVIISYFHRWVNGPRSRYAHFIVELPPSEKAKHYSHN